MICAADNKHTEQVSCSHSCICVISYVDNNDISQSRHVLTDKPGTTGLIICLMIQLCLQWNNYDIFEKKDPQKL